MTVSSATSVPLPAGGDQTRASQIIRRLEAQVGSVVKGKPEVIRQAVVCLLARGHMLIEDVPGVGKTTLAQALARSLGLAFQRIQFTSDLLPSDILGISVFRQTQQDFEFIPGPVFSNVVLADEINRTSPKTQSALLEAMSERRVSVDRVRHHLPEPFVVMATQNPLEYVGTFPLPESQLDRFMMSLRLGYPPQEEEKSLLLTGGVQDKLAGLEATVSRDEVLELQRRVEEVRVADKIADYLLELARETRSSQQFLLGVSTRGVENYLRAAQAMALCEGRDCVVPDDLQRLAGPVLSHRVVLKGGATTLEACREAVKGIVRRIAVPI
ncbi:MAG: MoxR family ATPase [bacterium]|nr:MoxR family ATPase [bacterium]